MKTITFYSYKGGVGRSLILANIAHRLAEFGKKVCMLDFDLEAPGLQCKFEEKFPGQAQKGIVDYISDFTNHGILQPSLEPYLFAQSPINPIKNITLIPAGNPDSFEYWKKLSSLNWYSLLYENPDGFSFFLDLKEKIRTQIQPDFLLIDSRTGISEMSGITLSLLADDVVIVSANNRENLEGVARVIKALQNDENNLSGTKPRITFVLSRIPFPEKPEQKAKELVLVDRIRQHLASLKIQEINLVHSDRDLELEEQLKIGLHPEDTTSGYIGKDYLNLFEKLTNGYLSPEEIQRFNRSKDAEQLFMQARHGKGLSHVQRIELLNKAIALDSSKLLYYHAKAYHLNQEGEFEKALKLVEFAINAGYNDWRIFILRGLIFENMHDIKASLQAFLAAATLSGKHTDALLCLAGAYGRLGDLDAALACFERCVVQEPGNSIAYNGLANVYRMKGEYQSALQYVYKALELDPGFNIAYATLAEINAGLGNIQEFYLNLEKAFQSTEDDQLKNLQDSLVREKIYLQFVDQERFKNLLEKYNVVYNYTG